MMTKNKRDKNFSGKQKPDHIDHTKDLNNSRRNQLRHNSEWNSSYLDTRDPDFTNESSNKDSNLCKYLMRLILELLMVKPINPPKVTVTVIYYMLQMLTHYKNLHF